MKTAFNGIDSWFWKSKKKQGGKSKSEKEGGEKLGQICVKDQSWLWKWRLNGTFDKRKFVTFAMTSKMLKHRLSQSNYNPLLSKSIGIKDRYYMYLVDAMLGVN